MKKRMIFIGKIPNDFGIIGDLVIFDRDKSNIEDQEIFHCLEIQEFGKFGFHRNIILTAKNINELKNGNFKFSKELNEDSESRWQRVYNISLKDISKNL